MSELKVSEQELEGLKALMNKQDNNARLVGGAWIEFMQLSLNIIEKVQGTRKEQEDLGKAILRAHGLDTDKSDYTIDFQSREIKQLVVADGQVQYKTIEIAEEVKGG